MSIRIFTDGSSRGNPGPGGWGVIIQANDMVSEFGGREEHTTNNRMELAAVIRALEWLQEEVSLPAVIHTDSKYVIKGATEWLAGWQKNGWKTAAKKDVENRDLWERVAKLVSSLSDLAWKHVDGHAGVPANERCDEIATSFADNHPTDLYSGSAKLYGIDLSVVKAEAGAKKPAKKSSGAKAYSYISLVDGEIAVHKTWPECFARIKGVSGARFKKSINKADEEAITREFLS
jgi:ribonuclease HI